MNNPTENDVVFEALNLPPAVEKLLSQLDTDDKISLQAYLEINNHLGDYPLHLVLSGLEEIRPGTTEEVMSESAKEAAWDRENRRVALFSEILMKLLAGGVAWSVALSGTWFAIDIFVNGPDTWQSFGKGVALLVFCIGGPLAAARFAGNSGVKIGKTLDEADS